MDTVTFDNLPASRVSIFVDRDDIDLANVEHRSSSVEDGAILASYAVASVSRQEGATATSIDDLRVLWRSEIELDPSSKCFAIGGKMPLPSRVTSRTVVEETQAQYLLLVLPPSPFCVLLLLEKPSRWVQLTCLAS